MTGQEPGTSRQTWNTPSLAFPFEKVSMSLPMPKSRHDCSRKKGRNFRNKTFGTTFLI